MMTQQAAQANSLRAEGERRRDVGMALAAARSRRPSRQRGYGARLRLADRPAAVQYLRRMAAALAAYDATPPAGTGGAANTAPDTTTTTEGNQGHETK